MPAAGQHQVMPLARFHSHLLPHPSLERAAFPPSLWPMELGALSVRQACQDANFSDARFHEDVEAMLKVSRKHRAVGAFISFLALVSNLHLQPALCTDRISKDDILEECLKADQR